MEGNTVTMTEIFTFHRTGVDAHGNVLGEHVATGIVPGFYRRLKQRGVSLPLEVFAAPGGAGIDVPQHKERSCQ